MPEPCILFDEGPLGSGTLFRAPRRLIRADRPEEVPAALDAIEAARAGGAWLAGYASYELGYVFSSKLRALMPEDRPCPLMLFGVFDGPEAPSAPETGPATLSPPEPRWSAADYASRFARVRDYIAAGDIYQANLTFPLDARFTGTPAALYAALARRQPVAHGAFVDLGGPVLLSRSPELFFALDAAGRMTCRPMKGTAPRGGDPVEDEALCEWLRTSEKNRAENLMIVDLMRNDMGRLAVTGSVRVPELFAIERYATLFQMTSRITAELRPGLTVAEIFRAIFPCGSITGAPKIRAMQIIAELEAAPRGAYCGSIGWIAPDGSMRFNVAIRTLVCTPDGHARLDVGGGLVYDSTAEAEYEEALLKSRYARLA